VFGRNATDLVHVGQAIMRCGGTVDYIVDTVFNYPTLSGAYKVAALDATNKIRALDAFAAMPSGSRAGSCVGEWQTRKKYQAPQARRPVRLRPQSG
jgi:Pyridine nucleotide-disulphide oxidoreductase, dimerisation domain